MDSWEIPTLKSAAMLTFGNIFVEAMAWYDYTVSTWQIEKALTGHNNQCEIHVSVSLFLNDWKLKNKGRDMQALCFALAS